MEQDIMANPLIIQLNWLLIPNITPNFIPSIIPNTAVHLLISEPPRAPIFPTSSSQNTGGNQYRSGMLGGSGKKSGKYLSLKKEGEDRGDKDKRDEKENDAVPKEKDLEETFFFFYRKLLPKFQEKFQALNLAEIFRLIFLRWQTLPMSEKMVYYQAMVAQKQGKLPASNKQKTVIDVEADSQDQKATQIDENDDESKEKGDDMDEDKPEKDVDANEKDRIIETLRKENDILKQELEATNQRLSAQNEKILQLQTLFESLESGAEWNQNVPEDLKIKIEVLLSSKKEDKAE
jgi:hypothetical protein